MKTRLASVDDEYDIDYGATFSLNGIDGKIENIKTNDEVARNYNYCKHNNNSKC